MHLYQTNRSHQVQNGDSHIHFYQSITGNLDPDTGEQIVAYLHEIASQGVAVVMATHNMQMLRQFPGRVVRCLDKELICE